MATLGIWIRLTNTGLSPSSIYLTDISGDRVRVGTNGLTSPGPVYVPTTGPIDLYYTSSVALSYEEGNIRKFITAGYITAELMVGSDVASAIHKWSGWSNHADNGTPQIALGGVWLQLTNDGTGANTNLAFLPIGVPQLWDTITNKIDLSYLRLGQVIRARIDLTVTPTVNNTTLSLRLWFPSLGGWDLNKRIARLDEGAGIAYRLNEDFRFFIGSEEVRLNGAQIEVKSDSECAIVFNGLFLSLG